MLRTLTARADSFPLHTPFRISRGIKTAADVVTVTIAQDGVCGRGEAVPYPRYDETVAGTLATIETVRSAIEAGTDRAALQALLPAGAARNALDCALWEFDARRADRSVAALTRRPPPARIASALTVGLDTPSAMAAAALRLAAAPLLKLKVDRGSAAAQIAAVREAAPRARLIVDPNESWRIDELAALQPLLAAARVDLLEQPLPAGDDAALLGFASCVPICADEAVHTVTDLARLAGRYQLVNIKLDKAGGLTGALALAEAARAQGFGLMLGCMVCSSLGIAPALLLAAEVDFIDLDGPLWLRDDRPGGVRDEAGWLSPPVPGFWGDGGGGAAG